MKKTNLFLIGMVFIVLGIFSCEIIDELPDEPINQNSRVNIKLTDDPIDADQVNIDLQKVLIKGDSASAEIELMTNAGIYNLLDFQNGVDTVVANSNISIDHISEIRFILGTNNTIMVDSILYDLTIPSGAQSGLKLKVNVDLDTSSIVDLLVDFDAAKSVIQQGNGIYKLHPVLKLLNGDGNDNEDDETDITLSDVVLDFINENYDSFDLEEVDILGWCSNDSVVWVELENDVASVLLGFNLMDDYLFTGTQLDLIPDVVSDYISINHPVAILKSMYEIVYADNSINYYFTVKESNKPIKILIAEDGTLICEL